MIFQGTKKVIRVGTSCAVFIDSGWEIETGTVVNIRVRHQDGTNEAFGTKKLSNMGRKSRVIYLDKNWGFKAGEWVNFELVERE